MSERGMLSEIFSTKKLLQVNLLQESSAKNAVKTKVNSITRLQKDIKTLAITLSQKNV
jgi:hypothetical protein